MLSSKLYMYIYIYIYIYITTCFSPKMTSSDILRPKHEALYYEIPNSCVDSDLMTANVCTVQAQLNVFYKFNITTNNN